MFDGLHFIETGGLLQGWRAGSPLANCEASRLIFQKKNKLIEREIYKPSKFFKSANIQYFFPTKMHGGNGGGGDMNDKEKMNEKEKNKSQ